VHGLLLFEIFQKAKDKMMPKSGGIVARGCITALSKPAAPKL